MVFRIWKTVPIGELCEGIYDGPHATPQKTSSGPIFLGISNLSNGRLDLSTTNHLSETDFKKWTRRVTPQVNDVVFSYETRLGEASLIPPGLKCCLGRRMALMRPDLKKVDPKFLLYAYLGPDFQDTIRTHTVHGSTVDRILLTEFPSYPITIPPLDEQKAIAHILGTLDDKIELNQQMNRTLEGIARAIFKSWFIDFDPVRAKMDGRQPAGMDAETAALFPDEFEDSALGKIPKDWKAGTLGDVCQVLGGFAYKSKDFTNSGYPVIKIKNINEDTTVDVSDVQYIPKEIALKTQKFWLADGDLVIAMTGATVGKFGLVLNRNLPSLLNQRVAKLLPLCSQSESIGFIFFALLQTDLTQQIVSTAEGSAQPNISAGGIMASNLLIPPNKIIHIFNDTVDKIIQKILENRLQSRTLTSIRDTLLPKLLSGEIRIKDAEKVLEEVA